MWQILYPVILVTFGLVLVQVFRGNVGWMIALPFVLKLMANAVLTPIQFGMRSLPLAFVVILAVWSTIMWRASTIWPHCGRFAVAHVPYFVWVSLVIRLQLFMAWSHRL